MSERLVPDAGLFEGEVERIFDTRTRVAGAYEGIYRIGRLDFPTAWIDPLIDSEGLRIVAPWLDFRGDPAGSFLNGRAWLAIRGAPAAVIQAAEWAGFDATFLPGDAGTNHYDHWAIAVDRVPFENGVDDLIEVGSIARSDASVHHRIVYNLDMRPARANHSRFGATIYGAWAGVRRRPGEPLLALLERDTLSSMGESGAVKALSSASVGVGSLATRRRGRIYARVAFGAAPDLAPGSDARIAAGVAVLRDAPLVLGQDRVTGLHAGVIAGKQRYGDARFVWLSTIRGERPRFGAQRYGAPFKLAGYERQRHRLTIASDALSLMDRDGAVKAIGAVSAGAGSLAERRKGRAYASSKFGAVPSAMRGDHADVAVGVAAFIDAYVPWSGLSWDANASWGAAAPRIEMNDDH